MSRRIIGLWLGILLCVFAMPVWADATITVDGDMSDWPADAFGFLDQSGDMPPPWADITQLWVTDDNSSGDDGYLYLGIEFISSFRPTIGGNDIDIYIYLDIDGDGQISGPEDRVIEITEGAITDGDGNLVGSVAEWAYDDLWIEVAIPYSVLGLENGSDTFGLSFAASGKPDGAVDASPEPGMGDGGFIVYDGAAGDDIEPLAVSLLGASAQVLKQGVELRWATASERRNAGFMLYRLDGEDNWIPLRAGLVRGLGDAPVGKSYRFLDRDGGAGDAYLIEDLDFDGRSHLHPLLVAGPDGPSWKEPGRRSFAARKAMSKAPGAVAPSQISHPGLSGTPDPGPWRWLATENGLHRWSGEGTLARAGGLVPMLPEGDGFLFVADPRTDRHAKGEFLRSQPGKVRAMGHRRVRGACANPLSALASDLKFQQQGYYYVAVPGDDPFIWAWTFVGWPAQVELDIPDPASVPARLRLAMMGLASVHILNVSLNGQALAESTWNGGALHWIEIELPAGLLLHGTNRLELSLGSDSPWDMVALDRVEVAYGREPVLDEGGLTFSAPSGACVAIRMSDNGSAWVFDVTDPKEPRQVLGLSVSDDELRWQNPNGTRRYLVVPRAATLPEPLALGSWSTQDLKQQIIKADVLLIAHGSLLEAAQSLAARHARQGLASLVLDVQAVFDSYSFGRPDPLAIRALVHQALSQSEPEYLLLLGSGSVDPLGHLETGPAELVPAPFARSRQHGYEFVSDAWYGLDVSGAPVLAVGRLSFEGEAEAWDWLAKSEPRFEMSAQEILFLADDYDPLLPEPAKAFELSVASIAGACFPEDAAIRVVSKVLETQALDALEAALDGDVSLVSYHGHAFVSGWSSSPVWMDVDDALILRNPKPVVLLSWTCFDGAFGGPWGESLAWAWVRNPTGGAVAAAAATTLSDPRSLDLLAEQVLCRLSSGEAATLGQALLLAKQALGGLETDAMADLLDSYGLLGDPTTPNPFRP